MCLSALSQKLEKDFSYLKWRAQIHQHSSVEVAAQFGEIVSNYRPLVDSEELSQFEMLVANYQSQL